MPNQAISAPLPVERRSELLDQLEEIVCADGFVGLTLDDFAARLRCSKTTLYRLAPTKEQLVATVVRQFLGRAAARVEAAVADAATPPEKIAAYLTTVGREMARGSATFHEQMITEPATARFYRRSSDAAAERVGELIRDGIHEGVFHIADSEFVTQMVTTIIHAIHLGDLVAASAESPEHAHVMLSDLLLYGVMGRNDSP
jgi:AcrR family transcriptional regulator